MTRTRLERHTSHGTHTHTIPPKRSPNGAQLQLAATGSLRQPTGTTVQLISKHILLTLSIGKLLSEQRRMLSRAAPHGQKWPASTTCNCPACSCSPRTVAQVNSSAQPPAATSAACSLAAVWPQVLESTLVPAALARRRRRAAG